MSNPVRVLLVDEASLDPACLDSVLADIDATLVRAPSPADAWQRMEHEAYAAVVLALRPPAMDGLETARRIRALPQSHDTPILFVSTGATPASMSEQAYALAAVDLLSSPVDRSALKSKLALFAELFRRRQADGEERRSEFIATLAHELRNPLAPMQNALHLMRLAPDNPEVVQKAQDILQRQLGKLVRLVDELIEIGRARSGKLALSKSRVPLKGLLDAAIEAVRPAMAAAGHEFQLSCPEPGVLIEVDAMRMAQVLVTLLGNAAQHTPAGGHIRLSARFEEGELLIAVTDNGVGIAAEQLPLLFDMFAPDRHRLDRAPGGLGTGLALASQWVGLHGGRLSAASAGAGLGSSFTIRLPRPPG